MNIHYPLFSFSVLTLKMNLLHDLKQILIYLYFNSYFVIKIILFFIDSLDLLNLIISILILLYNCQLTFLIDNTFLVYQKLIFLSYILNQLILKQNLLLNYLLDIYHHHLIPIMEQKLRMILSFYSLLFQIHFQIFNNLIEDAYQFHSNSSFLFYYPSIMFHFFIFVKSCFALKSFKANFLRKNSYIFNYY